MNFISQKEISHFQKFLKINWKKNHIYCKSKKILNWQHSFLKRRIDFFVIKKDTKIVSTLGIINQSRDKSYSEISLAIWISKFKSGGAKLFLKLDSIFKFKLIKGTTVNPNIIPLYKILGFNVQLFNQYYLSPFTQTKQRLSKNLIHSRKVNQDQLICEEISKISITSKNIKYIKWRFFNHPIYRYYFISDNKKKLSLIFRIIKVNNIKIMRIVDFIGSFKNSNYFINSLNNFLLNNRIEHLEFFHYGIEDEFIKKSGMKKINTSNQAMVVFNEPYTGLNYGKFYCCYKSRKINYKVKIVRADGDFDRPSIVQKKEKIITFNQ